MLKSLSTSLAARGVLAVVVGMVALAWPSVRVLALVILFAVYAFIAAGLQAAGPAVSTISMPMEAKTASKAAPNFASRPPIRCLDWCPASSSSPARLRAG